uniref:Cilia and flagella associated protein 61 n=1 Tax=Sinocyclocheilus grahami TaxID=75366 RepID=A0A672JS45_SINGR
AMNEVLAHASFSDHPIEELVNQAYCFSFLQPMNTLFLRLFVAQPGFSIAGAKEIMRHYSVILFISEAALEKIFKPVMPVKEEAQYLAYVCHRHNHCPRFHIRRARFVNLSFTSLMKTDKMNSLFKPSCILCPVLHKHKFDINCYGVPQDRDFCVISVPKLTPEFPLLQWFIRVAPRDTSTCSQELYLCHRWGLIRYTHTLNHLNERVVGLIIIRDEEDIELIRANFDVERFMYFSHEEHGRLCHFFLNPVSLHHTKYLFGEVLCLAHKSCLYYLLHPPHYRHQKISFVHMIPVVHFLIQVAPHVQNLNLLQSLPLITAPFALYHTNRKLTMEPKVTINARIVVVGASDTGLAFLEALTFCPHLRFNNLTLISAQGLLDRYSDDNTRFLATSHCYSDQDQAQLSLRSWISVVKGKMKAIKHKYDYLILCTGLQYQVRDTQTQHQHNSANQDVTPRHRHLQPVPFNLFILNDQHDCLHVHQWLMDKFVELTGDAVLYGNTIDVFTCVEMLMHLSVSSRRIHVVHPPEEDPFSCFHNDSVEHAVKQALEREEVHVHHDCLLTDINDGQHTDPVTSVSFTTDAQTLRMECAVFFIFSYKTVDYDTFKAINDAFLVFDGHLVIDSTFHTNDPSIYAAGPLTKSSRRYHADQWSDFCFNSKKVGQSLASVLKRFIFIICILQGRDIVTGRIETDNYIHLHLSPHDVAESITCLSKNTLPVSNLPCLYRKHQLLLNHLCSRYDEGLVHDMYRFNHRELVLHDRFADFERWMMAPMLMASENGSVSIQEALQKIVDDKAEFDQSMSLSEVFQKSEAYSALRKRVLDYLNYNRYHLTMYARPGMLSSMSI